MRLFKNQLKKNTENNTIIASSAARVVEQLAQQIFSSFEDKMQIHQEEFEKMQTQLSEGIKTAAYTVNARAIEWRDGYLEKIKNLTDKCKAEIWKIIAESKMKNNSSI